MGMYLPETAGALAPQFHLVGPAAGHWLAWMSLQLASHPGQHLTQVWHRRRKPPTAAPVGQI